MSLVVILDDRVTNRQIFTKLASSIEDGVDVRAFGDPIEGLDWMRDNTPDLVITDFKMPNLDGAQFVAAFRKIPNCVDIPVIVITVYEDRSFRLQALEAGATDFLQSPVDHHEFLTRARNLLKLRKQQQIIMSRANNLERQLISAERSNEQLVRDSSERLAQVIDMVPAMINAVDADGKCIFVNAYQARFSGKAPHEMIGTHVSHLLGSDYAERTRALDQTVLSSGNAIPSYEEEIIGADGQRYFFITTKAPLTTATGEAVNVLTTSVDITDRKLAEDHLHYLAHHDQLTGLANRTLLRDRIRREIARARRGDRSFALLFLDLDRFKGVNDALGHAIGDKLLKQVAARLQGLVRNVDTVARLGGDEFAILQTEVSSAADVEAMAQKILHEMAQPMTLDGRDIMTGASVGITLHPIDAGDADEMIQHADLAMYKAKTDGGNAYRFFAADMNRAAQDTIALEHELRRALLRKEFVLHYQPQIDLPTGRIVGAEALLRWQRPNHGLVGPGEFLPLAEENGLIVPINEWVLAEACRQAQEWQQLGLPSLRIAVNLSPIQFRKQDVCQLVLDILQQTGLDPECLELELTENIVMQNADAIAAELRKLRDIGVCFSIDDFGTGYSSLSYVKRFPVNRLKIDQCFIRNLELDPSDAAIVRAIISMAHSLNIDVTAEGVETAEQVEYLRAEGCGEVQGYFFSRPLPANDYLALVQRQYPDAVRVAKRQAVG